MHSRFSSLALTLLAAASSASAADNPALTIYRADGDTLFDNNGSPIADGYAIVHEARDVKLTGGRQSLVIDGLPSTLDAEAVAIDLGGSARVLGQRVLSTGDGGVLAAHRGERITIVLRDRTFEGTLLGLDNGALIVRDETAGATSGQVVYVRDYDTLRFAQGGGAPGSTLQLAVDGRPGDVAATLTYPTSGLGWRAAYSATLLDDTGCRMRLDALASIANRSGRNYSSAMLKLVAGTPNISHGGPRPVMYKSMAAGVAAPAPEAMPEQSALGDYRSYTIDGALDLPDASVTQVPLYAPGELACERRWIAENGSAWFPPKPQLLENATSYGGGPVTSEIRFTPTENLPAGNLRVLTRDRDGRIEFLGDSHIADTQKGRALPITLGNTFDLRATRERTAFSVDKAAREMNEGFRVTLTNSGDTARTITVREHPNRWRAWTLMSSSQKPVKQSPDLLEFEVAVPANGKATLDYAVKYTWTPKDE
jgi:hypothetical protein